MAVTQRGATLTEQHRQAQLKIRAAALRDFLRLWPIWDPREPVTFASLVRATVPLVTSYQQISSSTAISYYEAFRAAEGIRGAATPRIAVPAPLDQITTSMYVTGQAMTQDALRAGQTIEQARETALVRTGGAVTRLILTGGRGSLIRSVQADKLALGWCRVTDANPCAFCAVLASRGPVYKSRETASFKAHDHCACTAEPFYKGSDWPGRAREFRQMYNDAIKAARSDGTLERGTSNDLLNAFRRSFR